jgi:CDP-diacylglycerol--glycerol-3-phosphate 3-phosphatidyltransferase
LGYLLSVLVMYVLSSGQLQAGGALFAFASLFDALDGTVARATGQASRFGAFFDSVMDRFSEATALLGLLLHYQGIGGRVEVALIYVTIVGSLMVSYTRARAEGLGLQCKTGLLTRFERVVVLAIALMIGQVRPALWLMAVLTNFTALQRVHHVWRATEGG